MILLNPYNLNFSLYQTRVVKITQYLPSAPFLTENTSYHGLSFSLVSPALSAYTKYNLNECTILNQVVLQILKYKCTCFQIRVWI